MDRAGNRGMVQIAAVAARHEFPAFGLCKPPRYVAVDRQRRAFKNGGNGIETQQRDGFQHGAPVVQFRRIL